VAYGGKSGSDLVGRVAGFSVEHPFKSLVYGNEEWQQLAATLGNFEAFLIQVTGLRDRFASHMPICQYRERPVLASRVCWILS